MGDYQGKVVVVTGGGSGLGAAMADLFAGQGAKIVLFDIDVERAEAKAAILRNGGTEALSIRVDVSDKASVLAAADAVRARFGEVHVLCANVGALNSGIYRYHPASHDLQLVAAGRLLERDVGRDRLLGSGRRRVLLAAIGQQGDGNRQGESEDAGARATIRGHSDTLQGLPAMPGDPNASLP